MGNSIKKTIYNLSTKKTIMDKVTIKKGREGWQAETIKEFNGGHWQISTWKSGNKLETSAQFGRYKEENNWLTFSFEMFGDPRIKLYSEIRRNSEKAIQEVHAKGLAAYNEHEKNGTLPIKKEQAGNLYIYFRSKPGFIPGL